MGGPAAPATVLLLGTPQHPWELEDAFPDHRVLVVPREDAGENGLLAQLWERSTRLATLVLRETIPSPEIAAFLLPDGQVLVDRRLVCGDAWNEFLSAPWLREKRISVRLLEPGENLAPAPAVE